MHPFRFIHAADLQLESCIEGTSEFPSTLESRLLDISYRAAERLFDSVLEERIDFLLLSGNIIDPLRTGPGGPVFLIKQFERLHQSGIDVYWVGGEFDSPEDWPVDFPLPENVHLFPSSGIQEYIFQRGGQPIARLIGQSRNRQDKKLRLSDYTHDPGGLYTIALANGTVDPATLGPRRINFWALGGERKRSTFQGNRQQRMPLPSDAKTGGDFPEKPELPGDLYSMRGNRETRKERESREKAELEAKTRFFPYIVHYPGPTVGRRPKETDVYGATLVEIHPAEEPVLTLIPTAPLRWLVETIRLEPEDDLEKMAGRFRERVQALRDAQRGLDFMVSWKIEPVPGILLQQIHRGTLLPDLLSELRSLYGKDDPIIWSVGMDLPPPAPPAGSQFEQKTILGDYLRLLRHHQQHPGEPIDLEPMLPKELHGDSFAEKLLFWNRRDDEENEEETHQPFDAEATQASPSVVGSESRTNYVQSAAQRQAQAQALQEAADLGRELLGGERRKGDLTLNLD